MENNELQVTLGQLISKFDELNKKLDDTKETSKDTAKDTTAMNSSFLAMNEAIKNLGGSVPAVTSAFQLYKTTQQQVNIACKAFAANPIGATIQMIATVIGVVNTAIDKLKERIAGSEELTNKWNKATAALEPIFKILNIALDKITEAIVNFIDKMMSGVNWVVKLATTIGKAFGLEIDSADEAIAKAKEHADVIEAMHKKEIELIESRAQSEAKQAKLREQIAEADGKRKAQLLKELEEETNAYYEQEIALAKLKKQEAEYRHEQSADNFEAQKELAQINAAEISLEAERDNRIAKIRKQLAGIKSDVVETVHETAEQINQEFEINLNPETLAANFTAGFEARMKAGSEQLKANVKQVSEAAKAEAKAAEESKKTTLAVTNTITQAISSSINMLQQMAQAKQNQLEQDVKNGKISEEQAKKEFARNKKVQIALATISMLSGITQAITSAMHLPYPANIIAAASSSAMVAASGAMQIANIKKTTLDTSGSSASAASSGMSVNNTSSASVSPLLDSEFDAATINKNASTSGNSETADQRVYILESDIQASNKRVETRETNTTF